MIIIKSKIKKIKLILNRHIMHNYILINKFNVTSLNCKMFCLYLNTNISLIQIGATFDLCVKQIVVFSFCIQDITCILY
jgi:hypothetical protein